VQPLAPMSYCGDRDESLERRVTRIFLLTPIRLYRDAVAEVVTSSRQACVCGAAGGLAAACEAVAELKPDIVLLDAAIGDEARATAALLVASSSSRIVVLGPADDDRAERVLGALEAGAAGYVTRESTLTELFAAIEAVGRGNLVCSPEVAGGLRRRVASLANTRSSAPGLEALTRREQQIARLVADGLSNKEIALQLHIELPTVKNHVHRILEKLQVRRRGEAAAHVHASTLNRKY